MMPFSSLCNSSVLESGMRCVISDVGDLTFGCIVGFVVF